MKYIVDTCIIDKLEKGLISIDQLPCDGIFIATHIQQSELANTKDLLLRNKLLSKFTEAININIPTESFVIGISAIDEAKLGSGGKYIEIKEKLDERNKCKRSNTMDALIGEVALLNKLVLLTTDFDLTCVIKELNGSVIYFSL